ncbi:MAG: filamentous hemagglutinin N-terminal domain-containing protein [Cyanobacteria bacterium P01_C01_bin.118]
MLSKPCNSGVWLASSIFFYTLLLPEIASGQVVPDGSTPTPDPGPCLMSCTVTGGTADSNNTNLFHSFSQFSIPDGGVVIFDHPPTIRNLITRVTGDNLSAVNGTIRTDTASDTNFFLLNPSGIIFGPNSSLDIGGSFVATTANALQFGTQGNFSADDITGDLTLLTVNPSAFLFSQTDPQPITSQASTAFNPITSSLGLSVPENKSLLLVGGDVNVEPSPDEITGSSTITIPGGRLELGGILDRGSVELTIDGESFSLTYPEDKLLANVSLNNFAQLRAFNPLGRAGTVVVNANTFSLRGQSFIDSITIGSEDAGDIFIRSNDSVLIDDSTINSNTIGSALGGNLTIVTGVLLLNEALLSVTTNGAGDAGAITLDAETIFLNESSSITSDSFGSSFQAAGDTGEIMIQTDSLLLNNDSSISISTNGDALEVDTLGSLIIDAEDTVFLTNDSAITSETLGQRNAGTIRINASLLSVDDSKISAAVNEEGSGISGATGQGGTVTLSTPLLSLNNNAQITSSTSGTGTAGSIVLQAETLNVNFQEGAEISAATSGVAPGGRVIAIANEALTLSGNGSLSTRSTGSGPAGDVSIQTNGLLRIQDGARVEVSGESTGDSGTLEVLSTIAILDGGQLLASTQAGEDGNISLQIQDALVLRGDSRISAEAFNDADGGNVDISSPFIIALLPEGPNGNDIQASAENGDGGRITIQTNALFNLAENIATDGNQTNDLDASSGTGIDGEVVIQNLEVDPTEGIEPLTSDTSAPTIAEGCSATSSGQFTASGQAGTPSNPYEPISGDGIQVDIDPPGQAIAQPAPATEPLIEAHDWQRNVKGDVVLIAESSDYHSSCQHTLNGAS